MLRVATYNLYLGADLTMVFDVASPADLARQAARVHEQLVATDFPSRAEAIARILVREQVDVVGLQEVACWSTDGGVPGSEPKAWLDFLDVLVAALSRAGAAYDVHAVTTNFRGGAALGEETMSVLGHNVILVRKGSGVRVVDERTGDFTHSLDILTQMSDLVLNVARSWGWVDVEVRGRRLRFVNTHTEAWDEKTRDAQRDELLEAVGDPEHAVVVVGDFNALPSDVGMPAPYVDAWAVAGHGPGHTCGQAPDLSNAESTLDQRIDYVWARGVDVLACRVVGDQPSDRTSAGLWPSDHAGVVADLGL